MNIIRSSFIKTPQDLLDKGNISDKVLKDIWEKVEVKAVFSNHNIVPTGDISGIGYVYFFIKAK